MKVLITGARGMAARAAIHHCKESGDDVHAYDREMLDISNRQAVFAALESVKPDVVLNCAAFTNVDAAESNEQACFAANTFGVENLALGCRALDAGFVTISTDYVFDGSFAGYYTQRHSPAPQGVYARSKWEGERLARNTYGRSIVVRTGWIFGHGGVNFLSRAGELLAEGKPMRAIADAFGTPTFADDLAIRIRELAAADLPCIFHVTNSGEGTNYLGFAKSVCEVGGFDPELLYPIKGRELIRPAPRPQNSKLACLFSQKLGFEPLPDWTAALERYLKT